MIAVVQPHRYTRLASLFEDFCTCFHDADTVLVAPVYAAGEPPIEGASRDALVEGVRRHGHRDVRPIDGPDDLAPLIAEIARPGDLVVCLGAGSITQWANALPGRLAAPREGGGRGMSGWLDHLPPVRGSLRRNVPLAPLTWLRVGGPAEAVFQPADADDLAEFLRLLPAEVPVLPMGVASNLLVRDGGISGVVIRFGGPLAKVEVEGETVLAGAGALDQRVAQEAQRAGLGGLEFLIGIPGTVGGAVRMNAGAFGGETKDRLLWAEALDRRGAAQRLTASELGFAYRKSALPREWIVTRAAFQGEPAEPDAVLARMDEIRAEREAAQPLRVATGGSTFKNPPGHRAWQLIDAAGCRGLRLGAAMVSEKHCNFLINTGGASAAEIERLGELVRQRVREHSGVELEWEVVRIGRPIGLEQAA